MTYEERRAAVLAVNAKAYPGRAYPAWDHWVRQCAANLDAFDRAEYARTMDTIRRHMP